MHREVDAELRNALLSEDFLGHGAYIRSFDFYYGVRLYILCGIELCSVYICHDFCRH